MKLNSPINFNRQRDRENKIAQQTSKNKSQLKITQLNFFKMDDKWDASNHPPKQCSDCPVPWLCHLVTEKLTKSHSSANHCRGRWNQQKQQCIKLPGLTRSPPHTRHSACQSSTQVGGASANTNKNARVPPGRWHELRSGLFHLLRNPPTWEPISLSEIAPTQNSNSMTATLASSQNDKHQILDSKKVCANVPDWVNYVEGPYLHECKPT